MLRAVAPTQFAAAAMLAAGGVVALSAPAQMGVLVLDVDFHVETLKSVDDKSLYTNIYTLRLPGRVNYTDIITKLSESAYIHTVRTRSL